jgi:superfamily II DNA or RNA helicase
LLLPLTDQVLYDHLTGKCTVGVYPLLSDDTCRFLAIDFDGDDWREDARSFMQSGKELNVPAALEISRSGRGAHVWIFFSEPVPARQARQLGSALISHTCTRTRQLKLSSYDRLFPNQDTLPKGGFGNLIALPLQKKTREKKCSVFVNENFEPFDDQWAFLASVTSMKTDELQKAIQRATPDGHPLDVAFIEEEDEHEPWKKRPAPSEKISGPLPKSLKLVLANQIFIEKADLPQPLANRLIRLAAFQNPEFYKAQAMRLPIWDKPRVIGCAENFSSHIGLPRGCLDTVLDLLAKNTVKVELQDERQPGTCFHVDFRGSLHAEQSAALEAMLLHETGVLCAPTAFGKTVTAAALIAKRSVSTLILVHRIELLKQWRDRLNVFLDVPKGEMGQMGGGKWEPSYHIDIAVMQSLLRRENLVELLDHYGQIIVDECHHVSAFSFESILKQAKARFVIGLTATPVRRDGHQPIIFMQCGPIRHMAARSGTAPINLEVWPRMLAAPLVEPEADIQEVFHALFTNVSRNRQIVADILKTYQEGRKIIVLTARTEHLSLLREMLGDKVEPCYVLHGRIPKKQRVDILENLKGLKESTAFVLLATGSLIGEGFDHPPLDTLVLAIPISWKGTLQQYAGRLHREHAGKQDVRIYDYVEHNHPQLNRMWHKRLKGYRNMGYEVKIV